LNGVNFVTEVVILEAIDADRMSLVFRVEENLDGPRFQVDRTFENNCAAMADIQNMELQQRTIKKVVLRREKLLKLWRE
jgi:hypothetical protein